jgi:glycosyltransferase involved in cell wall biosynthesis
MTAPAATHSDVAARSAHPGASPGRTRGMHSLLGRIRRAPSILDVILLADQLAAHAAVALEATGGSGRGADRVSRSLIEATRDRTDAPTAIAAARALAHLPVETNDPWLKELLESDVLLAPHVAWSLADRRPAAALVDPLVGLVDAGRVGGMLAQRTLLRWAVEMPEPIARVLIARLRGAGSPGRARLVETLGVVGAGGRLLTEMALDRDEPMDVRTAAIAALGDRPGVHAPAHDVLTRLSVGDDIAGDTARLALFDLQPWVARTASAQDDVLRIAQIHLGGRLDRFLAHAGEGDTGGIATLLVQLGDALSADPRIADVTTIGRGTAAEALESLQRVHHAAIAGPDGGGHAVIAAPMEAHETTSFAGTWPAVVAAERGLRRVLRVRPPTVLHLRMADVGSLAAWRIARREGLPYLFSLAPDPNALIAEMERSGELDRATFGEADVRAALWYRASLVRHLADSAQQIALFPRRELAVRLRGLLGIDIAADPGRYHVVPEGIDLAQVRVAQAEVARTRSGTVAAAQAAAQAVVPAVAPSTPAVVRDLAERIRDLGPGRSGLPLAVSVGRLTEMKGMSRIVEAFAADPALRLRANLVIVGGSLEDPTPEERTEMDRIEALRADHPALAEALILLGHRPHDDVLRVMAVADLGFDAAIAPGGAYVCGSRKEEFGLAIVEAMAAGLAVVAPRVGGPASYVEDGVTGLLVDTMDPTAIGAGIHGALDLADLPGRRERAQRLVDDRFTIGTMSDVLAGMYGTARIATARIATAPRHGTMPTAKASRHMTTPTAKAPSLVSA